MKPKLHKYAAGAAAALALTACQPDGTPPNAADGASPRPTGNWQACPVYSDEVVRTLAGDDAQRFRELWTRTECGTIQVPLDYNSPNGRHITIALTRLKATDQAHRLGSLALNPGGPGGSGYLMPIDLSLQGPAGTQLNKNYDLIGFDPRGVGYSTKVNCPPADEGTRTTHTLTEQQARQMFRSQSTQTKACGDVDPAFTGQITTPNIAADLDRIRAALGEHELSFIGVSWGTWLGAVYRSMFADRVSRMWLDSAVLPNFSSTTFDEGLAAATERDFSQMAAWIAQRNDQYGFGSSASAVGAALLALRRAYAAHPKEFGDIDMPFDGALISQLSAQPSMAWPQMAQALKELRDATGSTAPPTVKEMFGAHDGRSPSSLAGAPEHANQAANLAALCNEDAGPHDFDSAWAAYQRRLTRYPMTGPASRFSAGCAGWPVPVKQVQLRRNSTSLVLSGHTFETKAAYEWTQQTSAIIGGDVLTVNDDVHGSALIAPDCAAKMAAYFINGTTPQGLCQGIPAPA